MKTRLGLVVVLSVLGCTDTLFKEQGEAKFSHYAFTGMVELGAPVNGATVEAYKFSGLKKGDKIAEAVSNRDGTFSLNLETDYDGPLLLIAQGGVYRDLATGEVVALKPSQELSSAITHIKMPEKTNINAWTSMAVARVQANKGFWDKSVAELKDVDRINVDFSQMSYFLAWGSKQFINVRRQEFFDVEKDMINLNEAKTTLHLAHAGLSHLAKNFSFMLAKEGIVVSTVDLVAALVSYLSDRTFDGRDALGNVVYVGNNHRVNLDSYTMRKSLAEAVLVYAKSLQESGKLSPADKDRLMTSGYLIFSLSKGIWPELFLEKDVRPKPLDLEAPRIEVSLAGDFETQNQFAVIDGEVHFDVATHDDSMVTELKVIAPNNIAKVSDNRFGPVPLDYVPNARDVADACGKRKEFHLQLLDKNIPAENVICACFEATDIVSNSTRELACFQRRALEAFLEYPAGNILITQKDFEKGMRAKARVGGGMAITECSWAIVDRNSNEAHRARLPEGQGRINGNSCIINEVLPADSIPDGTYHFVVQAKDLGGRILSESPMGKYQHFSKFRVAKSNFNFLIP